MEAMKQVAVVNDLSGMGNCSLTAALPVLAALGVQAYPLPTAVLSGQTGFPGYQLRDLTDTIVPFSAHWAELGLQFDAIYTGFLASEHQAEQIGKFLDRFRTPQTLLLVDPVMGDGGVLYPGFTPALCKRIAALARRADVVTPNLTEACYLAGADYREIMNAPELELTNRVFAVARAVADSGPQIVAVTGVHRNDIFYNVLYDHGRRFIQTAPSLGGSYSGTGDLFASVLTGCLVRGMDAERAVCLAVRFLSAALADTVPQGLDRNFGTNFAPHLHLLWEELL